MRVLLYLASAVCLGCSQPAAPDGVVTVDSAGVAIVTNSEQQLAAAAPWHLESSPSLWVRSEDTEVPLFGVTALARTESGLLAVMNRGTNQVLLFDAQGRLVATRGREGDGPGEFRWLSSVLPLGGDSLGVYDFGHKRLSVFDPDGRLVRDFTLHGVTGDYEQLFLLPEGGFAVFTQNAMRGGSEGVFRSVSESFSVDRNGRRSGSYGEFLGAELFRGHVAGRILFGANTHAAVAGDALVVGTATEPELSFNGRDGRLRRIVRWPDHDRRVTERRREEFIAAAEALVPEASRPQTRAMLEEVPTSSRSPAFEGILAGPEGELWVGEYRGPEMALAGARSPARSWLVFDSLGVLVARVSTPAGFQPLYLETDGVMGVYIDELGVESIQVYGVLREQSEGNGS